ncbi:hypothetical protein VFPFJ_01082 [Purpureocillium lilacinum]|uniref:Uncharacterized protein n=1 Tax=Purpureocillium lilacinum TaxID=33203 RepID=A0A179I0B2_PURLI|nr:hypothetical protein VFPFJ_01082 [Purpureocillium lilacinum]OAQ94973.1 hypothetical protein VFPFJ_01082 [Purpureocillium lilacinum]
MTDRPPPPQTKGDRTDRPHATSPWSSWGLTTRASSRSSSRRNGWDGWMDGWMGWARAVIQGANKQPKGQCVEQGPTYSTTPRFLPLVVCQLSKRTARNRPTAFWGLWCGRASW